MYVLRAFKTSLFTPKSDKLVCQLPCAAVSAIWKFITAFRSIRPHAVLMLSSCHPHAILVVFITWCARLPNSYNCPFVCQCLVIPPTCTVLPQWTRTSQVRKLKHLPLELILTSHTSQTGTVQNALPALATPAAHIPQSAVDGEWIPYVVVISALTADL